MSLYNKLTQTGTPLSITGNGSTPSINILATGQSKLHADGSQASYSVNGANQSSVNTAYQGYVVGNPNILPQPSQLDYNNGTIPAADQYLLNLPG
jgi:hypothetical protein